VGITLSGGLDSSTLACKAVEAVGDPRRVSTCTNVFRALIPDDEEAYSSAVARQLGVSHEIVALDGCAFDPDWRALVSVGAEPSMSILTERFDHALSCDMAAKAPVWLYGEGPDNALTFEWRSYFRWLWQRASYVRLVSGGAALLATTSRREWATAASRMARLSSPWIERAPSEPVAWLQPDFARASDVGRRAADWHAAICGAHPWRPRAMASFGCAIWPSSLERMDPTVSRVPIAWRHPFLDLRVLSFLLTVPPVPWSREKRLVRHAMRGVLPAAVLERPKTPLRADPTLAALTQTPLAPLPAASAVSRYVDVDAVNRMAREGGDAYPLMRAHVLDHWLTRRGEG
jgi:asparagine synthase (glutamine-hydrolysing)